MLSIVGMLYTEYLTGTPISFIPILLKLIFGLCVELGNGVLEAWKIGAISPFNDGQGIF